MGAKSDPRISAIIARLDALDSLLEEREDRHKERFAYAKESVALAMASADRAVSKAEIATDKRFEGVNEFRAALTDQGARLMPRAEYDVQHQALKERTDNLAERLLKIEATTTGKREGLSQVGTVIISVISATAAIGSLVGVIMLFLTKGAVVP